MAINDCYLQSEVDYYLWAQFCKTSEYIRSREKYIAIPKEHPIVIEREEQGLKMIIGTLREELRNTQSLYLKRLQERTPGEWVREWLNMHKMLFKYTLISAGCFRNIDVWFETEEASKKLYKIPIFAYVPSQTAVLAQEVCEMLKTTKTTFKERVALMAKIHFEFIRIHPFADGNGRIGRVIIDQLCLAFGLPTAMGGYPRADKKQRESYHRAIKECTIDTECKALTRWIEAKIEWTMQKLA